jgi:hypothetical protein
MATTIETFTLRKGDEIIIDTPVSEDVRSKIKELKEEEMPYFTFSNNKEKITFRYTKKQGVDGYYVKMVKYINPS